MFIVGYLFGSRMACQLPASGMEYVVDHVITPNEKCRIDTAYNYAYTISHTLIKFSEANLLRLTGWAN